MLLAYRGDCNTLYYHTLYYTKLRHLKDTVLTWELSFRRSCHEDLVYRLRIEHTRANHGYLKGTAATHQLVLGVISV